MALRFRSGSRIALSLVRSTPLRYEMPSRRSSLPGRWILRPGSGTYRDGVRWLPTKDPGAETSGHHCCDTTEAKSPPRPHVLPNRSDQRTPDRRRAKKGDGPERHDTTPHFRRSCQLQCGVPQ